MFDWFFKKKRGAYMDIEEFIETTLIQLIGGVKKARESLGKYCAYRSTWS
jgi:hypothetical protein